MNDTPDFAKDGDDTAPEMGNPIMLVSVAIRPDHAGLGDPLPDGLPTAVEAFFRDQAIVTRGQAAACLACLQIEHDLMIRSGLDAGDARQAMDLLDVDVGAAFALLATGITTPPPGVPLMGPPEVRASVPVDDPLPGQPVTTNSEMMPDHSPGADNV